MHMITPSDSSYPQLLRELSSPPKQLYIRGFLDTAMPFVAVVGTRKHTQYGKHVTEEIVRDLCQAGIGIVSGLAFGIDSIAHRAALNAQGTTIAVLGSGVDDSTIAPRAHVQLAHNIIENGGAILSEYPTSFTPTVYSFPARNRIIAGMSLATIVIEAGKKSGARITAQCALEYNRDVCAVPQNITSQTSIGPHALIKQGAYLITSAQDILDILDITSQEQSVIVPVSEGIEMTIFQHLSRQPTHVDDLSKVLNIPNATLMSTLTAMELKGIVKHMGNMMFVRTR